MGIAVQGLGVEHELAALGLRDRGRHADLAAELVGRPGLALADALDLRRMQAVELPAALALTSAGEPGRHADSGTAKTACSSASPAVLRRMSRITRPSRVRRKRTSRLKRLNCLAWA